MDIIGIGYFGFESTVFDEWRRYGPEVMGFQIAPSPANDAESLYFKIDDRRHRFAFHPGPRNRLLYIGWEAKGNSRQMIFGIDELLNFVDARIELRPSDLVFTGSTCGVGLEDGRFLKPGDVVEAEIERIGVLRNTIGAKRVLSPQRALGRLGSAGG